MSVDEAEKTQDVKLYFNCKDCDKRSGCRYRFYGCRHCGEKCETQTDGQKLWIECEKCGMRGPNTESNECDAWCDYCMIPSSKDWFNKAVSAWDLHDGMEDGVYLQFAHEGVTAVHLMFGGGNIRGRSAWYGVDEDDPESPDLELNDEGTYFVGPVNDRVDAELFPVFLGLGDEPRDETGKQIKECCTGKP